jgi:thioesterase domain-containing protein/acyl carrier protein
MSLTIHERLKALSDDQRSLLANKLGIEPDSTNELVGFVAGHELLDETTLVESLEDRLPMHMVPRRVVVLDELPRTGNGKIDYKSLRSRGLSVQKPSPSYPFSGDSLEHRLAKIWCDVLGVPHVGRDDDFFDLGGHSLLAMRMFSAIELEFGKILPLASIFSRSTVARLAEILRPRIELEVNPHIVTLQKGGTRAPLFCIHAGGGHVFHYRELARLLGSDRPVLGVVPPGLDGQSAFHKSVDEMAKCYADWIIATFPDGPYLLCGYSFGGTVAYDVARQLRTMGHDVAFTGLFDTAVFGTLKVTDRFSSHRQQLAQLNLVQKCVYIGRSLLGNCRTFVRRNYNKLKKQSQLAKANRYIARKRPLPIRLQAPYLLNLFGNIMLDYIPKPYAGELTVYRQESGVWEYRDKPDLGWGEFVTPEDLHIVDLPGEHGDMLELPLVQSLAESLVKRIQDY